MLFKAAKKKHSPPSKLPLSPFLLKRSFFLDVKVGRLSFLRGCVTGLLLSTTNKVNCFSPILVTKQTVFITVSSMISLVWIAIRFPPPSKNGLPSSSMTMAYSVRFCRMHSGYLTSAHDGHFPLFHCCYLRTLESS